ncbi:MAG: hypothetical protein BJ554DRAFT_6459 [Olpidium bornovanus]|uniref:Uncharacterized protein n=1 Tax=Olpidium bornovanus TaxID=278681 RepID=A0A8H8DKN8_9FUNG|nr:MAG: hypothetical protein BJ554DRAFT_6459 [Olpidium bornovanus]
MVAAKVHCDPGDFSFTFILVLGDFEPHFLCVPELGTKIPLLPGFIVALPSAYCDHFVSAFQGQDRFSLVFFLCSHRTYESLPCIPQEKSKYEIGVIPNIRTE